MRTKRRFDALTLNSPEDQGNSAYGLMDSISEPTAGTFSFFNYASVKCSWACRHVVRESSEQEYSLRLDNAPPNPADVALVQVDRIGHHTLIETADERRLRLYKSDRLMCVFGDRYATDVYEGRVLDLDRLHLLTGSGVIGTVVARHRDVERPTALSFLGYLSDSSGCRINLKRLRFCPVSAEASQMDVILVAGTSMSTGKTTVTRKILHALVSHGMRAAGCKLTGSASPRDLYELRATGALHATDFSDYGFPSTYGASLPDLVRLFHCMIEASASKGAQVVVMEVADGFLQRETRMVLESEEVRRQVRGVVLAGACSGSALCAANYIQEVGLDIWAVSGLMANSPLFVREFASRSSIPVASSRAGAKVLARRIMTKLAVARTEDIRLAAAVNAHK